MGRSGVLLTAFGGPEELDQVEAFCTNLMRCTPPADVLERVYRRYLTIGGRSPLPGIVRSLTQKVQERLDEAGKDVPVALGLRYSWPSIADGVASLVEQGVDKVVMVSLSPFESAASSGAYREAVAEAVAGHEGVTFVEAPSFRDVPGYLGQLADYLSDALAEFTGVDTIPVLFTAHSLPIDDQGVERYVEDLRETAEEVASRVSLPPTAEGGAQRWLKGIQAYGSVEGERPWLVAFQSKGRRGGEWLGPDLGEVIEAIAKAGFRAVAVSPIGFATNHMETLYDIDVEAAGIALDLDLEFQRAYVPDDSDQMVQALLTVIDPLL